jgi:hypothetical protein
MGGTVENTSRLKSGALQVLRKPIAMTICPVCVCKSGLLVQLQNVACVFPSVTWNHPTDHVFSLVREGCDMLSFLVAAVMHVCTNHLITLIGLNRCNGSSLLHENLVSQWGTRVVR